MKNFFRISALASLLSLGALACASTKDCCKDPGKMACCPNKSAMACCKEKPENCCAAQGKDCSCDCCKKA